MEIINYVQDNSSKRRFNLPAFQKKSHGSDAFTATVFSPKTKTFAAQKVRPNISLKSCFKSIGSAITKVQYFVVENIKKISIISAVIAGLGVTTFTVFAVSNHFINKASPLELKLGDTPDIENLNKLMATFALNDIVEYDQDGNLLDIEGFQTQVFTKPVSYQTYKVKSGDTISGITKKFGLTNLSTLISVNHIDNVRQLCAGNKLKIPSIDGILYTVKSGDTIDSIISSRNISLERLVDVNDLASEELQVGQELFLPGVALDSQTLKNAMGDLFKLPISASFRWTSMYGPRVDPIAGVKSFHTGVDMACPTGTPIHASMSGRVTKTGVTRVYGNYVIIDHGNGYQTLYAHMSKIIAKQGQWVDQGARIGLVGSTGYSTGPHLHFTVYKNGQLIDPMSVLNR